MYEENKKYASVNNIKNMFTNDKTKTISKDTLAFLNLVSGFFNLKKSIFYSVNQLIAQLFKN